MKSFLRKIKITQYFYEVFQDLLGRNLFKSQSKVSPHTSQIQCLCFYLSVTTDKQKLGENDFRNSEKIFVSNFILVSLKNEGPQ